MQASVDERHEGSHAPAVLRAHVEGPASLGRLNTKLDSETVNQVIHDICLELRSRFMSSTIQKQLPTHQPTTSREHGQLWSCELKEKL